MLLFSLRGDFKRAIEALFKPDEAIFKIMDAIEQIEGFSDRQKKTLHIRISRALSKDPKNFRLRALSALGLEIGLAGRPSPNEASRLYQELVEENDPLGIVLFSNYLMKTEPESYDKIVALYDRLVEMGNLYGMHLRALIYFRGEGKGLDLLNTKKGISLIERIIFLGKAAGLDLSENFFVLKKHATANDSILQDLGVSFFSKHRFMFKSALIFCSIFFQFELTVKEAFGSIESDAEKLRMLKSIIDKVIEKLTLGELDTDFIKRIIDFSTSIPDFLEVIQDYPSFKILKMYLYLVLDESSFSLNSPEALSIFLKHIPVKIYFPDAFMVKLLKGLSDLARPEVGRAKSDYCHYLLCYYLYQAYMQGNRQAKAALAQQLYRRVLLAAEEVSFDEEIILLRPSDEELILPRPSDDVLIQLWLSDPERKARAKAQRESDKRALKDFYANRLRADQALAADAAAPRLFAQTRYAQTLEGKTLQRALSHLENQDLSEITKGLALSAVITDPALLALIDERIERARSSVSIDVEPVALGSSEALRAEEEALGAAEAPSFGC